MRKYAERLELVVVRTRRDVDTILRLVVANMELDGLAASIADLQDVIVDVGIDLLRLRIAVDLNTRMAQGVVMNERNRAGQAAECGLLFQGRKAGALAGHRRHL